MEYFFRSVIVCEGTDGGVHFRSVIVSGALVVEYILDQWLSVRTRVVEYILDQ